MSKISTEELAQWLETMVTEPWRLPADDEMLVHAAARLRALAEDAERLDWLIQEAYEPFDKDMPDEPVYLVVGDDVRWPDGVRIAIDKARHD